MQPGQRLVRRPCRTVRLSALLLFLLPGCSHRPAAQPPPSGTRLAPAFADVRALALSHPAAAHLNELDRDIAGLEQTLAARPRSQPPSLEPPRALSLIEPEAPADPAAPSLEPDRERAESSIREDFAIRRLAQPDRADEAYAEELERLRRRYLRARPERAPDRPAEETNPSTELVRRMSELRRTIDALAPRAGDRLFYPPAELARRRQQLAAAQQELVLRQREQIRSIERALEAPPRRSASIPEPQTAEARERRDRLRGSEAQRLTAAEKAALSSAAEVRLPAPAGPPRPAPSEDPQAYAADAMAARVRERFNGPAPHRNAPKGTAVLVDLRRRRAEMAAAILRDTRLAAVAAGRDGGLAVTFKRGDAPDHTARVRALLAKIGWGNRNGGRS